MSYIDIFILSPTLSGDKRPSAKLSMKAAVLKRCSICMGFYNRVAEIAKRRSNEFRTWSHPHHYRYGLDVRYDDGKDLVTRIYQSMEIARKYGLEALSVRGQDGRVYKKFLLQSLLSF